MRIIKLSVAAILLLTVPFLFVVHERLPFLFRMQYSEELKHALYRSLSSAFISSLLCLAFTLLIIWTRYNAKKHIRKITDYIFLLPLGLGVPPLVSGIALITFFGANRFGKVLQPLGIDFVYTPAGVTIEDGQNYEEAIAWATVILCTGSTIINGTITHFSEAGKPVYFYGTTIAGAAVILGLQRLCAMM